VAATDTHANAFLTWTGCRIATSWNQHTVTKNVFPEELLSDQLTVVLLEVDLTAILEAQARVRGHFNPLIQGWS